MTPATPTTTQRAAAIGVHLYTATGSVLALLIVLAAFDGDAVRALWLGLLAMAIDGTDGMLARAARVKEVVPVFDGAKLDDIVDYLTYVFAPVILLCSTGSLPASTWGYVVAAVPLLASCYQFCRTDAKSPGADHAFRGFPSYWNVVAFYAVLLDWSAVVTSIVLIVCAVLVFVPIAYIYPSRTRTLRPVNLAASVLWFAAAAGMLVTTPDPAAPWTWLSVLALAYYAAASLYLTLRSPDNLDR